MDLNSLTSLQQDAALPLSSLRLLVPPVQLITASMLQVLKRRDVTKYWRVSEFVSLVVEMVPELLMHKHSMQLRLGLRARFILDLCRNEALIKPEVVLSYLDKMKTPDSSLVKESEEEEAAVHFFDLVHLLLKNPEERREFFLEVFPVDYGSDYDNDLQTLFWEFLCRLTQLLPVPDLEQTATWLGSECSVLDDCVNSVSEQTDLKNLLQYHKNLGHLEQHVPPSSMGDAILSSLCAAPPNKSIKPPDPTSQSDPPLSLCHDVHTVPFMDDVAVEIIAVTDYAEIELGTSANLEVAMESCEVDATGTNPEEETTKQTENKTLIGPHDCPDCHKKFRFASSLVAHRVIHNGERPHRCQECGRCFSFRQSLDRHRHTHKKTQQRYDCGVCGETFHSLSQRTEHKQSHVEDGVYFCHQCEQKFSCEAALEKHLTTHDGENIIEGHVEVAESQIPGEVDGEKLPEGDQKGSVGVRTSGRKRKLTMKLQVINLEKIRKRRKEINRTTIPTEKPGNCEKQSGGSAQDDAEKEDSVQQQIDTENKDKINPQKEEEEEKEEEREEEEREGTFSCSDCEKTFRFPSSLRAHQRSHTGEQPFSCSQCGRSFSFKQSLERHKQTHRAGRQHQCTICGEAFPSLVARREHQSSHMDNGEFRCSHCGRAFAWKSALVRHLKTHGVETNTKEAVGHKCPCCSLTFTSASLLNRHLHSHQEERSHACSCGKSFAHRAALTAHQRTHLKERPHVCSQCGKGFLYGGGLRSHMKIHSEEKPYMCSFCGKGFKRERNMKKHERYHTRQDVFRCSQCDKSFVYKATLVRHELTHSGERPFLCSDCGKGFFSHAELLKHERFHTGHKPFQCPHCDKSFTQSCYLTVHLRYHTGARPYSCSDCDKSFLSANRLKRHQRTHTGEKPYLCVECGKGFRQSYNLKIHQRTHDRKPT